MDESSSRVKSEGGSFMAQSTRYGSQQGRALALVAGLLLAGGVLMHTSSAQPAKPGKPGDKPAASTKDKSTSSKDKLAEKEKPPAPHVHAITLPKDAGNDVVEMVKVINTRLETGWTENKLSPSVACTDHEFIRRASLDIVGRIAKPEEIVQFFKDS